MLVTASHTALQNQLLAELWLKELNFLDGEIEIMKQHLSDIYYNDDQCNVMDTVLQFDETFNMQQQWLRRMKDELQEWIPFGDCGDLQISDSVKKSFQLQMQANRLINDELKDNFLKLFS